MFTWLIWIAITKHGELSARLYRFIERRVDIRICINLDTLGLDWSKLEDRKRWFSTLLHSNSPRLINIIFIFVWSKFRGIRNRGDLLINRTDDLSVTKRIANNRGYSHYFIRRHFENEFNQRAGWLWWIYFYPRFGPTDGPMIQIMTFFFSLSSIWKFLSTRILDRIQKTRWKEDLLRFRVTTWFYNFRPIYDFVHEAKKRMR